MFLGLRSAIYPSKDLEADTAWWAGVLGKDAYFKEPFYVGFDAGGFELGLDPEAKVQRTYWGVADIESAVARLVDLGAAAASPVTDVGGGIRTATLTGPGGEPFGIIENPHFGGDA